MTATQIQGPEQLREALDALAAYDELLAEEQQIHDAAREGSLHTRPTDPEEIGEKIVDGLGRCTDALRALLANPPVDPAAHPHYVEESVSVYLELDENGAWKIDPVAYDGYPLEGYGGGAEHGNCKHADHAHDDGKIRSDSHADLDLPDLPDAGQLLHLLARALGKRVIG